MSETLPEVAWWFAASDKLPHGDGRKVIIGKTLRVQPPLRLCARGLHWSIVPFDALGYAPGPILYKVRPGGGFLIDGDKGCSTERTALAVHDATDVLRAFARREALSVIHLWVAPKIVRQYLETGDDKIKDTAGNATNTAIYNMAVSTSEIIVYAARAAWNAITIAQATPTRAATYAIRAAYYAAGSASIGSIAAAKERFNMLVKELFDTKRED